MAKQNIQTTDRVIEFAKQEIVQATDRAIDNAEGNYDVLCDGTIEIDADNVARELGIELHRLIRIFAKNTIPSLDLINNTTDGWTTINRASRV